MIKSTDEFDKAVYDLLVEIRNSEGSIHLDDLNKDDLSESDFYHLSKHIAKNYVDGLRESKVVGNDGIGSFKGEPFINERGSSFIERFKKTCS